MVRVPNGYSILPNVLSPRNLMHLLGKLEAMVKVNVLY